MPNEEVKNPITFFKELGGLHDARIEKLSFDTIKRILCISIDDLNSNFLDLPEYQGLRPVDIIFLDVLAIDINMQISVDTFSIYDISVAHKDDEYEVMIECSPGGYFKCKCRSVELREN